MKKNINISLIDLDNLKKTMEGIFYLLDTVFIYYCNAKKFEEFKELFLQLEEYVYYIRAEIENKGEK